MSSASTFFPARIPPTHGPVEDAERGPQRGLRDDRENARLTPCRIDRGPVVEGRHESARAVGARLKSVPVDVTDLGSDPAQHCPGDQPVLLEFADGYGHVVLP